MMSQISAHTCRAGRPRDPGCRSGPIDRLIGVVVETVELGAPPDIHGVAGVQHEAHCGAQRLGPLVDGAERMAAPVEGAHVRAHASAAFEEFGCSRGFHPGILPQERGSGVVRPYPRIGGQVQQVDLFLDGVEGFVADGLVLAQRLEGCALRIYGALLETRE